MQDEIETILDIDIEHIHGTKYKVEGYTIDAYGEGQDKLLDACRSLQQSLPDDLEARREAALDALGLDTGLDADEAFHAFRQIMIDEWAGVQKPMPQWRLSAWKRACRIHEGPFPDESEYYPPEPEYPKQWLEYMSEDAAEWLYDWMSKVRFERHPAGGDYSYPPIKSRLVQKGFVKEMSGRDEKGPCDKYEVCKAPFLTGGLELPEFIDEEEL